LRRICGGFDLRFGWLIKGFVNIFVKLFCKETYFEFSEVFQIFVLKSF
jgi:hypothetical protein